MCVGEGEKKKSITQRFGDGGSYGVEGNCLILAVLVYVEDSYNGSCYR